MRWFGWFRPKKEEYVDREGDYDIEFNNETGALEYYLVFPGEERRQWGPYSTKKAMQDVADLIGIKLPGSRV